MRIIRWQKSLVRWRSYHEKGKAQNNKGGSDPFWVMRCSLVDSGGSGSDSQNIRGFGFLVLYECILCDIMDCLFLC